ncbi:MAG: hypothetical protein ACOYLS_12670 [Polymorphobacter sp.]
MSEFVGRMVVGFVLGPLLLLAVIYAWGHPPVLLVAAGLVAVPVLFAVIASVRDARRFATAQSEHDASRRQELADAKARALLAPTQEEPQRR